MQQLIKITSVPMQTVRMTQNARLVSSDSVDLERRKALARQMSFQRSHSSGTSLPMDSINRINRVFSRKRTVSVPQTQMVSRQQTVTRQQTSVIQNLQTSSPSIRTGESDAIFATDAVSQAVYETIPVFSPDSNYSQELSTSYTAQLGALEMRVATGDLTFLPPMVMTIVTQRPELHFEYLGDFNYVPPRDSVTGSNINLFT